MKVFLAIVLCIPLLLFGTIRVVNDINFDRNCEGYLKRAADANTVSQASKELSVALNYMEKNGLTQGYTSVLYTTPDEDIEFWYNNIKSAATELEKVTEETTQLERTNILMKLRETLLDSGDNGKGSVTVPSGISIYPYNTFFALFGSISLILFIVGSVFWIIVFDELS